MRSDFTNNPGCGRHFLQIPGPTDVPDRVLRGISFPTIDHRGPEFGRLGRQVIEGLQKVFKTNGTVVVYPSSGTGACAASLVNTLSPGDRILMSRRDTSPSCRRPWPCDSDSWWTSSPGIGGTGWTRWRWRRSLRRIGGAPSGH